MNTDEIKAMSALANLPACHTTHPKALERFAVLIHALALREAVKLIESYRIPVGNSAAGEMACDMTRDALNEICDTLREKSVIPKGWSKEAIEQAVASQSILSAWRRMGA
jgi:hypothetical protein